MGAFSIRTVQQRGNALARSVSDRWRLESELIVQADPHCIELKRMGEGVCRKRGGANVNPLAEVGVPVLHRYGPFRIERMLYASAHRKAGLPFPVCAGGDAIGVGVINFGESNAGCSVDESVGQKLVSHPRPQRPERFHVNGCAVERASRTACICRRNSDVALYAKHNASALPTLPSADARSFAFQAVRGRSTGDDKIAAIRDVSEVGSKIETGPVMDWILSGGRSGYAGGNRRKK